MRGRATKAWGFRGFKTTPQERNVPEWPRCPSAWPLAATKRGSLLQNPSALRIAKSRSGVSPLLTLEKAAGRRFCWGFASASIIEICSFNSANSDCALALQSSNQCPASRAAYRTMDTVLVVAKSRAVQQFIVRILKRNEQLRLIHKMGYTPSTRPCQALPCNSLPPLWAICHKCL